ncbi:MAG: class I SAM-dependent methyltransferase [Chitinophagaceae bacterium]|nr:class I SAM-dependent methyltransferase [Chitinophagaceae bacterium]
MLQRLMQKISLRKISKVHDIDGWLSNNEALGLYSVAGKLNENAVVVEIGSWQGKSTYCIARGLKSGQVFAIDPFNAAGGGDTESEEQYKEKKGSKDLLKSFIHNMESRNVMDKIVVKKGYSYEFPHDFEKIDFLFIDGDHSIEGCKSDFELFSPRIVPGGYIAFHDFYEKRDELGSTWVIKNLVLPSPHYKFYRLFDSLWVAQKIS